jgi:cytochrome c-type biogenesis protein CcmH
MRSRVAPSLAAMRRRLLRSGPIPIVLVIVGLALLFAAPAQAGMFDVAGKIMCLCGCNAVLSDCPHVDCGWGVPAKEFITQELAGGKTEGEMVQYYVAQYGEKVLAAPTKTGFNMAAWVVPFASLFIGAAGIYFLVTMWARRRSEELAAAGDRLLAELSEEDSRRLDDELKNFD